MVNTDWLNAQAAYLFRQAAEARRQSNCRLAEMLTGACRCLDRIAEHESSEGSVPYGQVDEQQAGEGVTERGVADVRAEIL